ncbi:hypothetical protein ACET3Z_006674 [Daucus carota]
MFNFKKLSGNRVDVDKFFQISAPMGEGEVVPESEHDANVDDDYSDEEMDVDELERRMWRDRMLLRRLKEQKGKEGVDSAKQRQSQEQARRKKMSRAQDGILKYMLKMMEVCKAQGFVYGIIPEKGKPVSGASDNLRAWWKEKVSPLAGGNGSYLISETSDYDVDGVDNDHNIDVEECKPQDVNFFLGTVEPKNRLVAPPFVPVKGELVDGVADFVQKRKSPADAQQMTIDQKVYTCVYPQCPYNDYRLGFHDRNSRHTHEISCPHRVDSSQGISVPTFQINKDDPAAFSIPFAPPNSTVQPVNKQPPFNASVVGLPDDGEKMISELMSFYDNNIHQNQNQNLNMNSGNLNILGDHNMQQQKFQLDDNFFGQGIVMGDNISQGTSIPLNQPVYPSTDFQFGQCKAYDSVFDANSNGNPLDFQTVPCGKAGEVHLTVDCDQLAKAVSCCVVMLALF